MSIDITHCDLRKAATMNQSQARRMVRDALKRGALIRPQACERCRIAPPPCSDGRSQIHGHHHDYYKPLDVEWLCAKCHRKETPLPKVMGAPNPGERNGQAKLTEVDVIACRRLRLKGLTYKAIAERFSVDKMTAMRAIKGQHWAHVQPGEMHEQT